MGTDERDRPIEVMINRYVKGKMPVDAGRHDWMRFHSSFRRIETTARGLAIEVYRGWAFCPIYDGRRVKENFRAAWHIALDFDTEDERSSLDYLAEQELVATYASFAYTTPSHTPEAPKARVVWVFLDPIVDLGEYETLYKAMLYHLPWADHGAKDGLRLYYGSPDCEVWSNWSVFAQPSREWFVDQYLESLPPPDPYPEKEVVIVLGENGNGNYTNYVTAALERQCRVVQTTPDGQRHDARYVSARYVGELVGADWAPLKFNDAFDSLVKAAMKNTDSPQSKVERTIEDGLLKGMEAPRKQPVTEVPVE